DISYFVIVLRFFFFFFQAEDGIRDGHVTGVQTCALPIYIGTKSHNRHPARNGLVGCEAPSIADHQTGTPHRPIDRQIIRDKSVEIGRASCRERVKMWEVEGVGKKEKK